ncbi:MAG TPA: Asp23/Gls24 family envelope stress response protein [Candidatus Limihabitans stercoravium]|nr:Asp23/Gls24 family envelope stress response protein [Candidatus Limihabitans stercoravium]
MKVVSKRDASGRLVYNSSLVKDVVDCALSEIDGVVKYPPQSKQARDSIRYEQSGEEMYIDIYVKLRHNVKVGTVAGQIQSEVKSNIENMTEFKVKSVNVHVVDVEFEENN